MKRDGRVDEYIARTQPFAQPIMERLRELMGEVAPTAAEDIRWGVPHWLVNGRILAGMGAFKSHARFFIHGTLSAAEEVTWERFGKLTSPEDCPDVTVLREVLEPRIALLDRGEAFARPTPKQAIPMPEDFALALGRIEGAVGAWESFTAAQRRDYLDWVVSAKREETRARRIATASEWIAEGKRRNWKYESC